MPEEQARQAQRHQRKALRLGSRGQADHLFAQAQTLIGFGETITLYDLTKCT